MKLATLFRIAAAVALLQFVGHATLFLTYKPTHGPEEFAVLEAMRTHHFSFSGHLRSYWDMYFGYGLFSAFNCLIEALLFWFIAPFADALGRRILPLAGIFFLANLGYTALISHYFFALPGYFDVTLAGLMLAALLVGLRRAPGKATTAGAAC